MRVYSTCVLVVWVIVPSPTHQPHESGSSIAAAIHDPRARFTLERAAKAAAERLERPECQRVLSDFRDAAGHTIQENLDRIGVNPRQYLARLTFREALDRRCRQSERLAFTTVGQREVFVCGTQLWDMYRIHPAHVEALIIHEMLHTLGLGENPPSSLEINARVLERCW
jgi:hypothetical protein